MLSFATLLVSALLAAPVLEPLTESAVLDAPTRHIRATDQSLRTLLRRGYTRSPTFAGLVRRLQQSDIIVYIESVPRLPGALEGRLMLMPKLHDHRYVRIQIALRGAPEDSVALLGHELQHAVELANASDVSDDEGMMRLYRRIGTHGGPHVYDTAAAQEMGRTVRRELSASPSA